MKITLILCCVAVAISFVIADNYSIDESFFDKVGLNRECYGNQTFKSYSLCDKRCDQAESAEDCPDVTYVGCGCKPGYIALDQTYRKCVAKHDCPK